MPAKNDYHIYIKNLRTEEEQGFMLLSGDKPFTIQGMDNTATRISDGEIRYSDFTNTRVFAQSEWNEGVSKFWNPKMVYSTIFPSHQYWDTKNVIISWAGQEFAIGSAVDLFKNFPIPITGISCIAKGATTGEIVVGTKWVPQVWRTLDYGVTWNLEVDLTGNPYFVWVDEITDVKVITNQKLWSTSWGSYISAASTYMPTGLYFIAYDNTLGQWIVGKKYYKATDQSFTMVGDLNISKYDSAIRTMTYYACGWAVGSFTGATNIDLSSYGVTGSGWEYCTYTWTLPNGIAVGQLVTINGTGTYRVSGITTTSIQIAGASMTNATIYTIQPILGKRMAFRTLTPNTAISGSQSYCGIVGMAFTFNGKRWRVIAQYESQIAYSMYNWFPTSNLSDITLCKSIVVEFDTQSEMDSFIAAWTVNITGIDHIWNSNKGSHIGKRFFLLQESGWEYLYVTRKDGRWFIDLTFLDLSAGASISTTAGSEWGYDKSIVYAVPNSGISNPFTTPFQIYDNTGIQWAVGTVPTAWCSASTGGYFASQVGTDDSGTQSFIYQLTFNTNYSTTPTATFIKTLGEQSVGAMHYYATVLYVGTNPDGWLYRHIPAQGTWERFGNVPKIDEFGKNYIDSMTDYNGKIVMSYQKWPGVYAFDPDASYEISSSQRFEMFYTLCEIPLVPESVNSRIFILNTGKGLLMHIKDNPNIYSYDRDWIADVGYMESSIYGWFIANMQKAWIYSYVRVTNGLKDDGSKVMFEVSFNQGETWQFCPTKVGLPFTSTQDWDDEDYSIGYQTDNPLANEQLIFFFPYNTNWPTIAYRVHMKKGTDSRTRVNHVGCHYTLNNKQELLINYQFSIWPSTELLDGQSREAYKQNEKMAFLKDTWTNQDICLITHIDGKTYHAIPFSDDRTPGQGLIVATSNSNKARNDIQNLEYQVTFTFKTIANYDAVL